MSILNTPPHKNLIEIQKTYSVNSTSIDLSNPHCTVDVVTRKIVIPREIRFFATQYEHDVNTIIFECDRYVRDVDLLTQTGVIEFINGSMKTGNVGFTPITEIDSSRPDKIAFTWRIYNDTTQIAGPLYFAVRFYSIDNQGISFLHNFVTLPATTMILDTLDTESNPNLEIVPSLLAAWLEKMNQISSEADSASNAALESAKLAEAYAQGRIDMPEFAELNAKYFMEATKQLKEDASTQIEDAKTVALTAIESKKSDSVKAVENAQIAGAEAIHKAQIAAIEDIGNTEMKAIQQIESTKDGALILIGEDLNTVQTLAQQVRADANQVSQDKQSTSSLLLNTQTASDNAATHATNARVSEESALTAQRAAEAAKKEAQTQATQAEVSKEAVLAIEKSVQQHVIDIEADRSEISSAKQSVTEMQQDVSTNKQLIDKTVSDFDAVAAKAVNDVDAAGTAQTSKIASDGRAAIEKIAEAQTTGIAALQQEGSSQVKRVEQAVANIVADRELIQQNAKDLADVKNELTGKADVIVESAMGSDFKITDSADEPLRSLRIFGKSTQNGDPSPESPVPIVNVGDKGTILVNVAGKNLCEEEIRTNNNIYTKPIALKAGTTYTLSSNKGNTNLYFNDSQTNENLLKAYGVNSLSYTPDKDVIAVGMMYREPKIMDGEMLQLELGSAATGYEPYKTPQNLTVQTPNGLLGIPVKSGGNYTDHDGRRWICDEIDYGQSVYIRRIGKTVVDGENIKFTASADENYWNLPSKSSPGIISGGIISAFFKTGIFPANITNQFIFVKKESISSHFATVDELNAFCVQKNTEGTPVEFYYMANPIETPLSPEDIAAYKQLHTNYPTTIILNDENADIDVAYVADTKNYIQKRENIMQKQLSDIQAALISQKISGGVLR